MNLARGRTNSGNTGLLDALLGVSESLEGLRIRAENAREHDELSVLGFCPDQMTRLCEILDNGRARIMGRITALGVALHPGEEGLGTEIRLPEKMGNPVAFLGAYRGCCRRLSQAMRQALRDSDAATNAILAQLAMLLEKQLWLIDLPQYSRGIDDRRSVRLFLAC